MLFRQLPASQSFTEVSVSQYHVPHSLQSSLYIYRYIVDVRIRGQMIRVFPVLTALYSLVESLSSQL